MRALGLVRCPPCLARTFAAGTVRTDPVRAITSPLVDHPVVSSSLGRTRAAWRATLGAWGENLAEQSLRQRGYRNVISLKRLLLRGSLGKLGQPPVRGFTSGDCWMHTRRGFDEALATTSHPLAADSLARIQMLYEIDEQTKALSFDERRAVHDRQSRPLIERLFASWDEALPTLRPSTKLAEAIGYALNRRAELTRFLDDGRIQLDTGHLERSIRPVAIGRKNFLFFGSLRGGQTAATLYSVVQSARLYHLDVTMYLTDLLRRLPAILPTDTAAIRPLLPDLWTQSHPTHVHASRDEELRAESERRRRRRVKCRQAIVKR
jgi:hypothetical protein